MESTRTDTRRPGRTRPITDRAWPGLLAPEQVVEWKPPDELLADLETEMANPDTQRAFTASNRLSLELYRSGLGDASQDVCRRQIAFAAAELRSGRDATEPWLVLLGLQSAINLIRIHGYGGTLELALDGLGRLREIADGEAAEVFGFYVPRRAVAEGTGFGRRVRAFARGNVVIETSKILFRRGLSGTRIGQLRELCATWPDLAVHGPFHAHELLCLHGRTLEPGDSDGDGDTPISPTLAAIARIRRLVAQGDAAGQFDGEDEALALYRERAQPLLGAGVAHARYLAALGDALCRFGEPAAAGDCFRDAYGVAAPVDPALANAVVRRGLSFAEELGGRAGDLGVLPPALAAARPDPSRLLKLTDLVATRFDPR